MLDSKVDKLQGFVRVYYNLWILVADKSKARFFQRRRPSQGIHLVDEIFHPEGRMKEREINADRPGRALRTADRQRSAYSTLITARDALAQGFAHELVARLEHGLNHHEYERLVFVAAPRMLGLIRAAASQQILNHVLEAWDKDLGYLSSDQVIQYLRKGLDELDRRIGFSQVV